MEPNEITQLLKSSREGDEQALNSVLPLVYDELHRIAQGHLRRYSPNHTLQPTELINEAWLKMADSNHPDWKDRVHFFAFTATVIRNILVDYARGRSAQKRGGEAVRVTFNEAVLQAQESTEEILALDSALTRLAAIDQRKAKILELRFFAGLDVEETAEALEISVATVGRETRFAQAWLRRELHSNAAPS